MYRLFHCLCYYCVSVCIFQGFPVPFLKRGRHFSLLSNYKKFLGIIIWKIITCGWLIFWLTCPKKIKSVLLFVLQCTLISVTNDTSSSWLFRLKTCDDCVEKFLEEFNERVQNLTVGEFEKLVSCICFMMMSLWIGSHSILCFGGISTGVILSVGQLSPFEVPKRFMI